MGTIFFEAEDFAPKKKGIYNSMTRHLTREHVVYP